MNGEGELIAAPGLEYMEVKNMQIVDLIDLEGQDLFENNRVERNGPVGGILNYMGWNQTDSIASLPLGYEDLRLNVHQNMDAVLMNTIKYMKGMLPTALIAPVSCKINTSQEGRCLRIYSVNSSSCRKQRT
jgi:hypothetical protein